MKTYTVTVRCTTIEFYSVEAESPEDAMERYGEGDYLGGADEHLETEAIKAKEDKQ